MSLTKKYWVESIEFPDYEDVNGDIGKAVISTSGHNECISVYGGRLELIERVIKIITALNVGVE